MILGGKMKALLEGRYNVGFEDIRTIAIPSLRHRVILNFEELPRALNKPASSLRFWRKRLRSGEGHDNGTSALRYRLPQKLEVLRLTSNRIYHGQGRGEHSTVKMGTSLEFSDYRNYQVGDDFRYIDWNIFSRLDRLFLKVFTAEEDLSIHILLDTSNP